MVVKRPQKAPVQGVCLTLVIDSLKPPDIFSQTQLHGLWWAGGRLIGFLIFSLECFRGRLERSRLLNQRASLGKRRIERANITQIQQIVISLITFQKTMQKRIQAPPAHN